MVNFNAKDFCINNWVQNDLIKKCADVHSLVNPITSGFARTKLLLCL